MPPEKPRLPASVIADFETWITMGAPGPMADDSAKTGDLLNEARRHWAFQPLKNPIPPTAKDRSGVKNPVDAFVLARLAERGWTHASPASRTEWIRRVTFDLTGLPATPEEIEAYEGDTDPRRGRAAGRSAVELPTVRRTVGPALARRHPLRRDGGLRIRPDCP